jgi:hypothetical protein
LNKLICRQEEDNDEASVIDEADIFETRPERIRRRISLVIINIVGFISTLGFSIVLTGAYPYLLQVPIIQYLMKLTLF